MHIVSKLYKGRSGQGIEMLTSIVLRSLRNWQHRITEFKFRAILTISECHSDNRHKYCTTSDESRRYKGRGNQEQYS